MYQCKSMYVHKYVCVYDTHYTYVCVSKKNIKVLYFTCNSYVDTFI